MKTKHWMLIRKLCWSYIAVVAILFVSGLIVLGIGEYGAVPTNYVGCYAYDSLLVGYKCSGFPASDIVAIALEFPLFHLYMPFFVMWNPVLIIALVLMYSPIFLLVLSNKKVVSTRV